MPTALVATPGQLQACVIRVARLSAACVPSSAAGDVITTSALVSLQATPEMDEATKFEVKNACGNLAWTQESGCDKIKRFNLTLELATFDYEMMTLLTGGTAITGKTGAANAGWVGKTIGYATPGLDTTCPNGVSIEVFSKTAYSTGACTEASAAPAYVRHIFPRAFLTPGERNFANEMATLKLSGYSTANPVWNQGPFGDWQGNASLADDTAYAQVYAATLPALSNTGLSSQGGGFT